MPFVQPSPRLRNQYDDDAVLRAWLRRTLPPDVHRDVEPGLRALGHRAATDLRALADAAEAEPPRHVPNDAWGRRVDRIETSAAWRALDAIAAEEGIVATAYERATSGSPRPPPRRSLSRSRAWTGDGEPGSAGLSLFRVELRDAQVLSIWEGTTNVLALDVRRAAGRAGALAALRDPDAAHRADATALVWPATAP